MGQWAAFLGLARGSVPTGPQSVANPGLPEESPAFGGTGHCGKGLKYSFLDFPLTHNKSKGLGLEMVIFLLFKGQLKN